MKPNANLNPKDLKALTLYLLPRTLKAPKGRGGGGAGGGWGHSRKP